MPPSVLVWEVGIGLVLCSVSVVLSSDTIITKITASSFLVSEVRLL